MPKLMLTDDSWTLFSWRTLLYLSFYKHITLCLFCVDFTQLASLTPQLFSSGLSTSSQWCYPYH